jgi:uncharacterized membrane protein (DUF4010 family)
VELIDIQALGLALGLGLLVGLQREWADERVAGIRTFTLITLCGALTPMIAERTTPWVVVGGLLAITSLVVLGNVLHASREGDVNPGMTTEVAAIVMFLVGAGVSLGFATEALVVGGSVAVLLHWKEPLHRFADRIGKDDLTALVRFVLIALVVLPVLPNRAFGPYDVLNPFEIWLMVVLIVGISLGAYVVYKLLGARVGTVLSGILGGLISSTATTMSVARRGRGDDSAAQSGAIVVVLAATVVFARVLLEVFVVASEQATSVVFPLATMMTLMAAVSVTMIARSRGSLVRPVEREAPTDLGAAIVFVLLYAAVLFAVAAAKDHFGNRGLYVVAAMSGLTDMDAITLSTARLMGDGAIEPDRAWRLILVGATANNAFKFLAVLALGNSRLTKAIAIPFGISLLGGAAVLALWQ